MSLYSMTVWRLWVCSISGWLMPKFEMSVCSLCVSMISALDECLLDNCFKDVRVLNASVENVCLYNGLLINESMIEMTLWRLWVCGISVSLMPKFEMSVSSLCLQDLWAG